MRQTIITDLSAIALDAQGKEDNNSLFYAFLLSAKDEDIDNQVHAINAKVETAVDCTRCGNCCRSLMINVKPEEVDSIAVLMKQPPSVIKEKYIEESMQGQLIINTIPCHFLADNKCSIYEHRFTECRDFPHLHKPGFVRRFSGTVMHYGSCPIIYNVIELLKEEMNFNMEGTQ